MKFRLTLTSINSRPSDWLEQSQKIQDGCQKTPLKSSSVNPDAAEQGHRS